ncbi:MAG: cation:proton antiporter [Chloroflexota bacterium]
MTNEFLHFILAIVIIIIAAKAGGYISIRLGQPSVLGELVAGIILGPTVLNMLHVWPIFATDEVLPESLTQMAEIGVILLMFLAGLELEIGELLRSGKVASLAGTLGVVIPLIMGTGTALLFGSQFNEASILAWPFPQRRSASPPRHLLSWAFYAVGLAWPCWVRPFSTTYWLSCYYPSLRLSWVRVVQKPVWL